MKILVVAPNMPFRPLSGGSVRLYHLTREWGQRHQVQLVAPVFALPAADQVSQYEQELNAQLVPVPVRPSEGWKHATAYLRRFLGGAPPVLHYPELVEYLTDLAKNVTFDVIYVEGTGFGGGIYFKPFINQPLRPRFVLTFLDVLWHWWKREFFHSPRLSSFVRWIVYSIWEPRFVRAADCCVFISQSDQQIVERVVKPQQAVIGSIGVDIDVFPITPVPNTKDFLFVGSFLHQPNVHAARWLLREIYPKLCRTVPEAKLTLVGLSPPSDLIALADSVGAQIYANVPDLVPFYQRTRVVVVPIQTGGGIRVKILEACAASRPIVTTTIGAEGLPLVSGEHGLFADTTEEFVASLARLFEDDQLACSLAANGRLLVQEHFTWPSIAEEIERSFTT